jgi:hypothetical protein
MGGTHVVAVGALDGSHTCRRMPVPESTQVHARAAAIGFLGFVRPSFQLPMKFENITHRCHR